MKRLVIHFFIAVITFFTGVAVNSVSTASRTIKAVSKVQAVETTTLETPQPIIDSTQQQTVPDFVFDYDPKELSARGVYFILGRKPKDFREFDSFTLAEVPDGAFISGDLSFDTYSSQRSGVPYRVTGWATKKQLSFMAAPVTDRDYVYSFDGYFLKSGDLLKSAKNQAVLEGRLIKLKGFVKIAEAEVKFRIEYLGC